VLVDEAGDIWFRQSWLDTAQRCNERGRLALTDPDETTNDLALIGTAAHAAIEQVLNKEIEPKAAGEYAYSRAISLCDEIEVRWSKHTLPGQLGQHARRCADAWVREIMPAIELGGRTEVDFKVPLFDWDGHTVGITGTVDYLPPTPIIIDWKTASRKFYQRDKQRAAIQPTVYATAAARGAFGDGYEWPITFRYGVMVRGNERATTQLLDVQRTHAHEGWLLDMIETYLNLATALGVQRKWPRNEDHYLCNQDWCPWWSRCKGARLSTEQDRWSA
jgi:hypothetical protein